MLYKLKIEENKIESVNNIFCLNKLKLKKIYVNGNPFCEKNKQYRSELFKKIKTLEAIDGTGKDEENIESTEYAEEDNYCGEEDFEEAESEEQHYEESKIEGHEEYEEEEYENENEDEHGFDDEKNGDNFYDEINNNNKKKKN